MSLLLLGKFDFSDSLSPHTVAGCLKMYIRELKEPLVPIDLYHEFINTESKTVILLTIYISGKILGDALTTLKLLELRASFEKLPSGNRRAILMLLELFRTIAANISETKMGADNIGIVWGPNILRLYQESIESIMDMPVACAVVTDLIKNSEHFRVN
jgi:hypothetical protein